MRSHSDRRGQLPAGPRVAAVGGGTFASNASVNAFWPNSDLAVPAASAGRFAFRLASESFCAGYNRLPLSRTW